MKVPLLFSILVNVFFLSIILWPEPWSDRKRVIVNDILGFNIQSMKQSRLTSRFIPSVYIINLNQTNNSIASFYNHELLSGSDLIHK